MGSRMVTGSSSYTTGQRKITLWFSFESQPHLSHILLPMPSVGCYSRAGHEVITLFPHTSLTLWTNPHNTPPQ